MNLPVSSHIRFVPSLQSYRSFTTSYWLMCILLYLESLYRVSKGRELMLRLLVLFYDLLANE